MKAYFGHTEATDFRLNPEEMEPNPEENEAVLERQRVHNEETAIHSLKDDQNETNAYNEATEKIEQDPGMMRSVEEHQDVPGEDVAGNQSRD
jgi:hypothetical protein